MLNEAREYGRYLGEMLAASHFSVEEKEAWAFLISQMTREQLKKFDLLLKADIGEESRKELADLLVGLRAAQHKRELSMAALQQQTDHALGDLEKELKRAG